MWQKKEMASPSPHPKTHREREREREREENTYSNNNVTGRRCHLLCSVYKFCQLRHTLRVELNVHRIMYRGLKWLASSVTLPSGNSWKTVTFVCDHFSSHLCGRIIVHSDMALVTIGNHTRDQSFFKININVTKNRPVEFVTIFRPPIKGTIFRPFWHYFIIW